MNQTTQYTNPYETMTPAALYADAKDFGYIEIQGNSCFLQSSESMIKEIEDDEADFGITQDEIEASPFWLLQGSILICGVNGREDPFSYLGGRA